MSQRLVDYLPISRVVKLEDGQYFLDYDYPKSIGYIAPFYGNFGVILKAYAYILRLGREGIVRASENAVLAANYLRKRIEKHLEVPHDRICMHEFVASAARQAEKGCAPSISPRPCWKKDTTRRPSTFRSSSRNA